MTKAEWLKALTRTRKLNLRIGPSPSGLVGVYLAAIEMRGELEFRLLEVAHAAATKALRLGEGESRRTMRFAAGGLLAALAPDADGVALRGEFGDFTSGFCHWIGVGVGTLFAKRCFSLKWSRLNPIPMTSRKKVFDYVIEDFPRSADLTFLEFRARSSTSSLTAAISQGVGKKPRGSVAGTFLVVGTRVGLPASPDSFIRVVDPTPPRIPKSLRSKAHAHARRLMHYARALYFAGLDEWAMAFQSSAQDSEHSGKRRWPDATRLSYRGESKLVVDRGTSVGVESELPGHSGVKLFQGIRKSSLDALRSHHWPDDDEGELPASVAGVEHESVLPDGSTLACTLHGGEREAEPQARRT